MAMLTMVAEHPLRMFLLKHENDIAKDVLAKGDNWALLLHTFFQLNGHKWPQIKEHKNVQSKKS